MAYGEQTKLLLRGGSPEKVEGEGVAARRHRTGVERGLRGRLRLGVAFENGRRFGASAAHPVSTRLAATTSSRRPTGMAPMCRKQRIEVFI